jgi:hypothetical protein
MPMLRLLSFLLLAITFAVPAFAEDYPPPTFSIPDTDTTPVDFSVGDIAYRVPRNYITTMENWKGGPQKLVTLAVNIPDLKPFSEDTTTCFTEKDILRQEGCEPFSFEIVAPGQNSTGKASSSSNICKGHKPLQGPFGYQKYVLAPGEEFYKKTEDGRILQYSCQVFESEGKRDGICEPVGNKSTDGPILHYNFALNHLEDIDQIDAGLRNLVDSFIVGPQDE